jgi:hypothetical protein
LKQGAVCLLALIGAWAQCGRALAATAYVTDQLILGVYAEQNQQGQRLATLHSGTGVETLGSYTQVRTGDGITGWVKSSFLVSHEPAAARVKELEDELSRAHATTPALAEAAAQSEAQGLRQALAASQTELASVRASLPAARGAPAAAAGGLPPNLWRYAAAGGASLAVGFWFGYATLARRISRKFGGIKIY